MSRLLYQIIAAITGLWIATLLMPEIIVRTYPQSNFFGLSLNYQWQMFLLLGGVLGLLNYFLKPLLNLLALPLKIVTLGFFTILIDVFLIWVLDKIFDELFIPSFLPLLYAALIVCGLNIIIGLFIPKTKGA